MFAISQLSRLQPPPPPALFAYDDQVYTYSVTSCKPWTMVKANWNTFSHPFPYFSPSPFSLLSSLARRNRYCSQAIHQILPFQSSSSFSSKLAWNLKMKMRSSLIFTMARMEKEEKSNPSIWEPLRACPHCSVFCSSPMLRKARLTLFFSWRAQLEDCNNDKSRSGGDGVA